MIERNIIRQRDISLRLFSRKLIPKLLQKVISFDNTIGQNRGFIPILIVSHCTHSVSMLAQFVRRLLISLIDGKDESENSNLSLLIRVNQMHFHFILSIIQHVLRRSVKVKLSQSVRLSFHRHRALILLPDVDLHRMSIVQNAAISHFMRIAKRQWTRFVLSIR